MSSRNIAAFAVAILLSVGAARAETPVPHDGLEANLWTQRSVEFKGNALSIYALGQLRQLIANTQAGDTRADRAKFAAIFFRRLGLGIESVDVARPAREKNEDQ